MTSITLVEHPVPLRETEDGTLVVGKSRIPVERVVHAFLSGSTPEEIAQQFETLQLGDVYAVISYYLAHRNELNQYIAERSGSAARLRHQVELQFDPAGIRERLTARRSNGSG